MKKKILLFLFLGFSGFLYSQSSGIHSPQQLQKTFQEYFSLNRESVYLHLNKTKVLPTEGLWFSAYVFDPRTMKPNLKTTNLHVNIYNNQGQLITTKTIFTHKGRGQGHFKLDTVRFPPGKYVIKAFTKFMKNYREDLSFTQGFQIIKNITTPPADKSPHYDLQLLPEGGHLLADAPNTVGIKLLDDQGRPRHFTKGRVLDDQNQVVTTFKSNRFGMAKFTFHDQPDHHYRVELTPDKGPMLEEKIPAPESRGLSMTVNNFVPQTLYISLYTNPQTLNSIGGKTFYVAIHREGILESVPFTFPEDKTQTLIKINKDILADGVNVITIFNDSFDPLLERQVFYGDSIKRASISAKILRGQFKDSLSLRLHGSLIKGKNSMSISVLPAKTQAYTPKNDILSAFYIRPFIKGDLLHGNYYFSKGQPRRKAFDLDLLLLTQGWSKYKWRHIFKGKPKVYYPAEHGFSLSGRINRKGLSSGSKVFIRGEDTNLFRIAQLDSNQNFQIDHLFLIDGGRVHMGLITPKKGKLISPKIYTRVMPAKDSRSITAPRMEWPGKVSEEKNTSPSLPIADLLQSSTLLNAVIIKSPPKEKQGGVHRNALSGFITGTKIKIDEDMVGLYPYITDLIAAHGYKVNRGLMGVSITTRYATSLRGVSKPVIKVDGVSLANLDPLLGLTTDEVYSVYIDKMGSATGINGSAGVIQIFTKAGLGMVGTSKKMQHTRVIKMKNGFEQPKAFYSPRYRYYYGPVYAHYGVIDWFPNVRLNQGTGFQTIKIPNTHRSHIKLFIQGMAADGTLISETLKIKVH